MKTAATHKPTRELLPAVLFAAKNAGKAIVGIYQGKIDVEYKDDRSPLTLADKRAHDIIVDCLSAREQTRLPILSEEGKALPYGERKKWDYFWMVDPLDGTKEFIKRNDEFTVNIALIHGQRPVLGVIYVPIKKVFYWAVEGDGAYRFQETGPPEGAEMNAGPEGWDLIARNGQKLPLDRPSGAPFTIVGSRSHATKALEDFVNDMRAAHGDVNFISAGSSIKLCLVAEGKADIYPRLAPTMEWDTAAGQAIVEQAGGAVLDAETEKPLKYNKKNLVNPWFIASMGEKS